MQQHFQITISKVTGIYHSIHCYEASLFERRYLSCVFCNFMYRYAEEQSASVLRNNMCILRYMAVAFR